MRVSPQDFESRNPFAPTAALLLSTLLFSSLTLPFLNEPFIHHHDLNSAYWSLVARNYALYGPWKANLAMLVNTGPIRQDTPLLTDIRHPPLYPLILSLGVRFFGDHEYATRGCHWLISLALIFIIFITLGDLVGRWPAALTTILTIFTPIFLYFSTVCDFEQLTLLLIWISLWAYIRWFRDPRRGVFLFLSLLFYFLSTQADWQGYELGIVVLHTFFHRAAIQKRGGEWKKALFFPAVGLLAFAIYLGFATLSAGGQGTLLQRFLSRSGSGFYSSLSLGLLAKHLIKIYRNVVSMFTYAYLVLIVLALFSLTRKTFRLHHREDFSLILILLLFGLIHFLIFPVATFVHDYLAFFMLPAFGFTIAFYLRTLNSVQWRIGRKSLAGVALLAILFLLGTQSMTNVSRFRRAVELDVREPARTLASLTPSESVIFTNMKYQGHQLGYYAKREIVYADKSPVVNYENTYFLEFKNDDCRNIYRNKIDNNLVDQHILSAPKRLLHESSCFEIYQLINAQGE